MFSFIASGKLAQSSLARFQNRDGEPTTVKKAVIQGKNKTLHEKGSECYWLQILLLRLEFVRLFLALCTNVTVSKVKKKKKSKF